MATGDRLLTLEGTEPVRQVAILGNLEVDLVLGYVDNMPRWGEERIVGHRENRAAGSAGYTALMLGALGYTPRLYGCIGDDAEGAFLLKAFRDAGLTTDGIRVLGGSTGLSVTMVRSDGERCFLNHLGCLAEYGERDLQDCLEELSQTDLVLVSGYFLMPRVRGRVLAEFFSELRQAGVITALDTGDAVDGWTEEVRNELQPVLQVTDCLFANRDEVMGISGSTDFVDGVQTLREIGVTQVIAKMGAMGSGISYGTNWIQRPAYDVNVRDTVGAGDAFNAGFIGAWIDGFSVVERLEMGLATSALFISSPTHPLPTKDELEDFMRKQAPWRRPV